jgi:hypothetical protein
MGLIRGFFLMAQEFDLWGDPVPEETEKRGRPPHEATPERRMRVAVLRALKHTTDEIAAAIGISERTLRTKYLPELKGGLAQKRAEALVQLWSKAQEGNVSAIKEFLRQVEKSDLVMPRQPMRPARPPKLGKKEQALIDAGAPDTTTSMGELMTRRAEGLLN